MDMWDSYVASVTAHLSGAAGKIVFDKFHIAQRLSDAVDKVRRQENSTLRQDDRLVGTKYKWLCHPANYTADAWRQFQHRDSALKTAAWALKETGWRARPGEGRRTPSRSRMTG